MPAGPPPLGRGALYPPALTHLPIPPPTFEIDTHTTVVPGSLSAKKLLVAPTDRFDYVGQLVVGVSVERDLNQVWQEAVMIAADLVAWTRMLACTGDAEALALCGAQSTALPRAARRSTADPQRPTAPSEDPRNMSVGHCYRRRVQHDRRDAQTRLISPACPRQRHPETRPPAPPPGTAARPHAEMTPHHQTAAVPTHHQSPGPGA